MFPEDLRPYQRAAVEAALRSLHADTPALLVLPPGAGKTAIATAVAEGFLKSSQAVAYIAPSQQLLTQARAEFARGSSCSADDLARLVSFATTVSALGVLVKPMPAMSVALVIVDESHWAETATTGKAILEWARHAGVPVLGLTATPSRDSVYRIAHETTHDALVEAGFLARARIQRIHTGVRWRAFAEGEDLSVQSLAAIAANVDRNNLLVKAVVSRPQALPAFVFGCHIAHANALVRLFNAAGIRAAAYHSGQPEASSNAALQAFRDGHVDVLVGVQGLTLGIDVPHARGVVLGRPTLSPALLTQMIGRGTRLDPRTGKIEFHIIELVDHEEGAERVLSAATVVGHGSSSPWRVIPRHRFDPLGEPSRVAADAPASIADLWYRRGQTFGIELELSRPEGIPSPAEFRELAPHFSREIDAATESIGRWRIVYDCSAGLEIVSPILEGEDGLREMVIAVTAAARAAEAHGVVVTYRCGFHLHLGLNNDYRLVRRVLRASRLFESGLATLVAPSRIAAFDGCTYQLERANRYCAPLRVAMPRKQIDRATKLEHLTASRYLSVNPLALTEHGTIEVRLHSGTIDPAKIGLWVSLWQQIIHYAEGAKRVPRVLDVARLEPDGDIVALATRLLPDKSATFLERLHRRRGEVAVVWGQRATLAPWLRYRDAWQIARIMWLAEQRRRERRELGLDRWPHPKTFRIPPSLVAEIEAEWRAQQGAA